MDFESPTQEAVCDLYKVSLPLLGTCLSSLTTLSSLRMFSARYFLYSSMARRTTQQEHRTSNCSCSCSTISVGRSCKANRHFELPGQGYRDASVSALKVGHHLNPLSSVWRPNCDGALCTARKSRSARHRELHFYLAIVFCVCIRPANNLVYGTYTPSSRFLVRIHIFLVSQMPQSLHHF